MKYIESIKIIDNSFPGNILPKGLKIQCDFLNIFVGNQGTGKSSLLEMISTQYSDVEIKLAKNLPEDGISSFYFDSEKMNPRVVDPQNYSNPGGQNVGIGYGGALESRFQSHGEVLEKFIIDPLLKAKDCIIFLDEPEAGLSIHNQFRMIRAIDKACENNCQLFIATHCYPLIEEFWVYSMDEMRFIEGIEFLNKNKM